MKNQSPQTSPLVLVIDDEQEILDHVKAVLNAANMVARCCARPEDAFAVALETPPSLILCDMNLFGESGPEVCERIKRQPGLETTPVVFLSAAQMPDIIRRGQGATSTYCIRKPFASNVLTELISTAIAQRETFQHAASSHLAESPQPMALNTVRV
jgi:sigma-B regulation protein RsbU (phosphoserine phosphatase)